MKSNDTTWYSHFASLAPTAAILALVVGGCSVLPAPLPPDNIYLLEAPTIPAMSQPVASARRDVVLAVSLPRARAGYDTSRMVWVRQAHGLETYARSRWADVPARMLAPLIVQALERSGAFHAVVSAPSGVAAGLRLDTELVRLQQDFTVKPSEVRFTLGAQLIDTATQRVIATAEFDETEKCESEDAYGGVRAANRALERLLARVVEFCAGR
ncbi:MAG: ABC-type transport auxiliary lipoprotein family protein [Gallionella sp.]|jgi:cholesterol transport system auxiliary component|nr:ABC-type transport auxiliary lipoprotein family protein [Gallionella sp.]MCK9353325.1 ABC-type transport auxiliary lipoprotein family protein [Gallionella sp.]